MLESSELSAQHKLLLIDALPPLHPHEPPLCAYTLTNDTYVSEDLKTEQKFRTTERFTPVGESTQRWSLLRINGRSPTNQDLDLYELDQNARIREVRVAPWQLERNLPLHTLTVAAIPTDLQRVIFSGKFDFKPDKELEAGEFEVTLIVNLNSRRMEKYAISLQSPIQPNQLSAVSQYELSQDWDFNDAVNRLVRTKTYYKIAGGISDKRFWSEATIVASEFYCPAETPEQDEDVTNPCLEHVELIP